MLIQGRANQQTVQFSAALLRLAFLPHLNEHRRKPFDVAAE